MIILPLISPLFALGSDPESNLPACCRRNGAHHCMMSAEQMEALLHGEHLTVIRSKCPLYPTTLAPAPHQQLALAPPSTLAIDLSSQPQRFCQPESWAGAMLKGARHKRGPPESLLS